MLGGACLLIAVLALGALALQPGPSGYPPAQAGGPGQGAQMAPSSLGPQPLDSLTGGPTRTPAPELVGATAAATGVGSSTGTPSPATSAGKPSPYPVQRALVSTGGTVVATCVETMLTIDSTTPAVGYWLQSMTTHGTSTAAVVFASAGSEVSMTVVCQNGAPVAVMSSRPA